jgi:hypothetical protein
MLLANKPGCIVPDCCDAVQQSLAVVLLYNWDDLSDAQAYTRSGEPMPPAGAGREELEAHLIAVLSHDPERIEGKTQFDVAIPQWRIGTALDYSRGHGLTGDPNWGKTRPKVPEFCPFCATNLPDIERRPEDELPGPVHRPVADGDYCGTCDERSRACECWGPEVLWRTIPANEARRRALGRVVADFEAENGPITEAEIAAVEADWAAAAREPTLNEGVPHE